MGLCSSRFRKRRYNLSSLSPCVKLVLVNYQVQLDSGMNPPLVFTVINAVIPNAFKTREKCCTGG